MFVVDFSLSCLFWGTSYWCNKNDRMFFPECVVSTGAGGYLRALRLFLSALLGLKGALRSMIYLGTSKKFCFPVVQVCHGLSNPSYVPRNVPVILCYRDHGAEWDGVRFIELS